jgi:DNA-binding response OmpR family regulator
MIKRIVVIDDDQTILQFMKIVLEAEGYLVETFSAALGATSKILEIDPDLILIDINMPGLSGVGFIEMFKRLNTKQNILMVFHSSIEENKLEQLVTQHGASGYIPKGISIPQLINKVNDYLGVPEVKVHKSNI